MRPTLAAETFPDTTEIASVDVLAAAHQDAFGEIRRGEVRLPRDEWDAFAEQFDAREDLLRIDAPDGETLIRGRFDGLERDGANRVVTVASSEVDLLNGEPMPTVTFLLVDDSSPVQVLTELIVGTPRTDAPARFTVGDGRDAIPRDSKPAFSEEVTTGPGPVSQAIREQAAVLGHEIRYRDDIDTSSGKWYIDFLANAEWHRANGTYNSDDHLGSVRDVTLSPANDSVLGEPDIVEDSRMGETHVKAFGAQDGPRQLTATAESSDYDGGRRTYDTVVEKSATDPAVLQAIAETRLEEIRSQPRLQEITLETPGRDFVRGDFVQLSWPDEGIDRELRVVAVRDLIDADGVRQELTLSTRRRSRPAEKQRQPARSISDYETGFGGFLESQQLTSGYRTVAGGNAQRLDLYDFPQKAFSVEQADLVVDGRVSPDGFAPSDVDVVVGGTTVDTISGGSFFSERYDVRDELSSGTNRITAEPDTEGDLSLTLLFEVLRAGDTFDG